MKLDDLLKKLNFKNLNEFIEFIDRTNTGLTFVYCDKIDCKYYYKGVCGDEYTLIKNGICVNYEKIDKKQD